MYTIFMDYALAGKPLNWIQIYLAITALYIAGFYNSLRNPVRFIHGNLFKARYFIKIFKIIVQKLLQ